MSPETSERPTTLWRSLALLRENPMCSLECRRSNRGWKRTMPLVLWGGLLYWPVAVAVATARVVPWPLRHLVAGVLLYAPFLLPGVPAAVLAAGHVARAVRTGTWTHLLLTPLSPDDKALAVLWPALGPARLGIGTLAVMMLGMFLISEAPDTAPAILLAVTAALLGTLAGGLVGVWAGVRSPRQGTAIPVAFFASLCLASLTLAAAVALVEAAGRLIDARRSWELLLSDAFGAAGTALALTLCNALACALLWLVVPRRLCPDE